jgi:predicted alpha/beta-fold hydrolase
VDLPGGSASRQPVVTLNPTPLDPADTELVIAQTRSGGHVAFSEGIIPGSSSWMERVILDWFDAVDQARTMKDKSA